MLALAPLPSAGVEQPEPVANVARRNDDLRLVFVAAATSLYRIRVKAPGLEAF